MKFVGIVKMLCLCVIAGCGVDAGARQPGGVPIPSGVHLVATARDDQMAYMGSSVDKPFDVWYFEDACIVSQIMPFARANPPVKSVFVYWYGDKAPDGDFSFQNWVTPGWHAESYFTGGVVPMQVRMFSPLWHLLEYNRLMELEDVKKEVMPVDGSTVLTRFTPKADREGDVMIAYPAEFAVDGDAITSATFYVNTYPHPSVADSPTAPKSELFQSYAIAAKDFDPQYPTIPRSMRIIPRYINAPMTITINNIAEIPDGVEVADVLRRETAGLIRIHQQAGISPEQRSLDFLLENLADGKNVSAKKLANGKTILIYVWASWAPEDMPPSGVANADPPYELIKRLKELHRKHQDENDFAIVGVSLDVDKDAARLFVRSHDLPWPNYVAPTDKREQFLKGFGLGKVPSLIAISRTGAIHERGIEAALGYRSSRSSDVPPRIEQILYQDRAAKKTGGYARHWLGDDVVKVLENFDRAEAWKLSGENLEETYMGQASIEIVAAAKLEDKVFDEFPIVAKRSLKADAARQVRDIMLSDKYVGGRSGEESYFTPGFAFVFHGKDQRVVVVTDTSRTRVYLGNDWKTEVITTREGSRKFDALVEELWPQTP